MVVSIFIPVYNGGRLLSKTLDSVLGQSYCDLEVLCVDDTSSDNSYAMLQEYALHDSRIRVFRKPHGGTVPLSWEYVIPFIKGDFVLYMSQDDLLKPNTLECLVARQKETSADAVIPHEIHYVEGGEPNGFFHLKGINGDVSQVVSGKEAFRLMIDYSISGRALWPTNVIKEYGIKTDAFNSDELAQRQWILACDKVAFSDAVFLYCRNNPQSITEHFSPKMCEDALTNARLLELVTQEFPNDKRFLETLGNQYFFLLYQRMINYCQRKKTFAFDERKKLMTCFRKAYGILRSWSTLGNWKFKVGKVCFGLLQAVVMFKCFQYKRKGILLSFDLN